ncbi:MAG: glycosyltransferase [Planctomycetota bacterium]|jgi:UDP-N-acetylglucosamine transferase subunit ALG13
MIFLTVGTQFPFDRLVKAVDHAVEAGLVAGQIVGQIGRTKYRPGSFPAVQLMEKQTFDGYVSRASAIISHAGMGTIEMALELGKPLLAMPRRKEFGEVVNNHQFEIAEKFEELGHILVAYHEDDLVEKTRELSTFMPKVRKHDAEAVIERIAGFLSSIDRQITQKSLTNNAATFQISEKP